MPRHPPCAFTRLTCFRFDISLLVTLTVNRAILLLTCGHNKGAWCYITKPLPGSHHLTQLTMYLISSSAQSNISQRKNSVKRFLMTFLSTRPLSNGYLVSKIYGFRVLKYLRNPENPTQSPPYQVRGKLFTKGRSYSPTLKKGDERGI